MEEDEWVGGCDFVTKAGRLRAHSGGCQNWGSCRRWQSRGLVGLK